MYNFYMPFAIIAGMLECPFILVLLTLGLAAYFKSKNRAVMYAIILFTVITILNLRVLFILFYAIQFTGFDGMLVSISTSISIIIALVLCFVALIIGARWYIKDKDVVVLCLAIFFGLYGLTNLLVILIDAFGFRYIYIAAYLTGIAAYLVGIAAMIIALVRPKRMLAAK